MRWKAQLAVLGMMAVMFGLIPSSDALAVMSADLGSEFLKIAIVKPGVPMEIVLNRESQRKSPVVVSMRDGERMFSDAALQTAINHPRKAFWYLTHLVGKKFEDPEVELFRQRFPYYNLVKDEKTGTVRFRIDEETEYSPEELLGMILERAKEDAETFAEQPIKDIVITVPAFYNQAERRAIIRAARMVDLNVLQLMSDNAAVALNYGIFRRKEFNSSMQYYIFYDMGATSTTATVVGYQVVKTKEGTIVETNPQVVVKGVGFDKTLGGLEITLRLRKHLAQLFNDQKKTKTDVFTNERSMGKLFKEASRVKKVLSANNDHFAQVEGLLEEKDFRAKVTRADLETLCADLFDRVTKPIEDALKASEITLGEINEVILMGGSSRVPKVQEKLKEFLGGRELGKSINTDEAAALGAVYQAAHLSKGFRVKKFIVKEGNIYPIVVQFERQTTAESGETTTKLVNRTLFGYMNPYPQKKVMTFNKHFKDFHFWVRYGNTNMLSEEQQRSLGSGEIHKVKLSGVEESFDKHSKEAESKGVKAHFRLDESGLIVLESVESVFEKQPDPEEEKKDESAWSKLGSAIGGLFGGAEGEGKGQPKEENTKEEEPKPSEGEKTEEKPTESAKQEEDGKKAKEGKTEEQKTEEQKTEDSKDKKTEEGKDTDTSSKMGDKKKDGEDNGKDKKDEKEEEKPKKPKVVVIKDELKAKTKILDLPEPSEDSVKESKSRLAELRKNDQEKLLLQKAKNELESFIFETRDKLYTDEYEKCSVEEERESLRSQLIEAEDWQYEQEDSAGKDVFIDKLKELKAAAKDLFTRVKELQLRPKAVEELRATIKQGWNFSESILNLSKSDPDIFTQVEMDTLIKVLNETEIWLNETVKLQDSTPLYEAAVLTKAAIMEKGVAVAREMQYLITKMVSYKQKPPKSKTKEDKNTTDSAKGNTTTDTEGPALDKQGNDTSAPEPPGGDSSPPSEDSTKGDDSASPDMTSSEETPQLDAPDTATTGGSTDQEGAQVTGDNGEAKRPSTNEETNPNTDSAKTIEDSDSPEKNHDAGEL
ncbi:hypoxia up-regulated protein 1-like isoform X2 [Liolophura sinensis]|uniref:hypoxia up-regulated protein 1-like isoform X2 n=1 Tax=Liolophura sinensis TaxID=3198878 RepID=UPI0031587EE8